MNDSPTIPNLGNAPLHATAWEHFLAVRDKRRLPHYQVAMQTILADGGTLLDWKITLADRALDACDLCPHHCRVNRNRGETGFCGVRDQAAVHWEGILHGEELELVPSHEIFLSGCTMRCAFCYSHEHIVRPMSGTTVTPGEMADCVARRHNAGATNLNLVGGEPMVHIPHILRTLRELGERGVDTPVVWNSNMYATDTAMGLLNGVVDLYLGDIHFGNNECAAQLGRIPRYFESVTHALLLAAQSGASVVIRHLVMPGHLECCARPTMEWATQNLPHAPFHLMLQYIPDYRAENDPVLGRTLNDDERTGIYQMAESIGVNLYRETQAIPPSTPLPTTLAEEKDTPPINILIHADGRITFTRLSADLLSVAHALNGSDDKIVRRLPPTERIVRHPLTVIPTEP